ncbi:MAG TPA: DUF4835 family protein [Bacteroidota bacterium]|jgi:hypothetical protein|nr:DUF4835 family protein [Bacteroidota bacterium]
MIRLFAVIGSCLFFTITAFAQELDCDISIDPQSMNGLSAESRENLVDIIPQLKQYISNYRWTKDGLEGGERIKFSMALTLSSPSGDNHYKGQLVLGSQRPVYKGGRSTRIILIKDVNWDFQYIRSQTLTHDEYRFDPMLSLIDFYAYMVLGYDFDTYKSGDGTQYFQKAQDIVNKARSSASAGAGWESSTRGSYSRTQLLDEILNPKYHDFREAAFRYHYRGLDLLYKDQVKARKNMLSALEKIGKLQEKINATSLSVKLFFDAKYQEIAEIFSHDPDPAILTKLTSADPSHRQAYEESRLKQR